MKSEIFRLMPNDHASSDLLNAIEHVFTNDILLNLHGAGQPFASIYSRREFFTKSDWYILPTAIFLGILSSGSKAFSHHVSISLTIKNILKDKNFEFVSQKNCKAGIYQDYVDGSAYSSVNQNTLNIIMYQDEVELVNPLGSAKRKYKITCFYYTVGQICAKFRSTCGQIQLALMCRSIYI